MSNLKTKIEIINEVANHFNSQNRAIDSNGFCAYITEDGKKCAVGMFLNSENNYACVTNDCADNLFEHHGYKILKEEYQIEDSGFWTDLQRLHDKEIFWDENGLTETGEGRKQFLLKKYAH